MHPATVNTRSPASSSSAVSCAVRSCRLRARASPVAPSARTPSDPASITRLTFCRNMSRFWRRSAPKGVVETAMRPARRALCMIDELLDDVDRRRSGGFQSRWNPGARLYAFVRSDAVSFRDATTKAIAVQCYMAQIGPSLEGPGEAVWYIVQCHTLQRCSRSADGVVTPYASTDEEAEHDAHITYFPCRGLPYRGHADPGHNRRGRGIARRDYGAAPRMVPGELRSPAPSAHVRTPRPFRDERSDTAALDPARCGLGG